jgi:ring-1,2-phenylacetyl-CoA epoxidase subunit PaaE
MTFHHLQIAEKKQETHDTVSLTFAVPEPLRGSYRFKAGQYVNLKVTINSVSQIRSYSLCSTPDNTSTISVGVKKMDDGYVSKFLNDSVTQGQTIEVSTPDGHFFMEPQSSATKVHILVGGGSGITPCLSIIKTVLSYEKNSRIHLIYSVKSKQDKIFGEELDALAAAHPQFTIKYLFTFEGDKMIDTDYAKELISVVENFKSAEYYACGPGAIISSLEHAVESFGIAKTQFHREYFTAKAAEDMQAATVGAVDLTPLAKDEKTKVTLKFEGRSFHIDCKPNQKIIDAAIDSGVDAPYSCLVAACCTCRAKLVSGNIEMLDKDSLTDAEIKEGYVLTCQAQPRSHGVVLDFDL